jgi:hypothetical protein
MLNQSLNQSQKLTISNLVVFKNFVFKSSYFHLVTDYQILKVKSIATKTKIIWSLSQSLNLKKKNSIFQRSINLNINETYQLKQGLRE